MTRTPRPDGVTGGMSRYQPCEECRTPVECGIDAACHRLMGDIATAEAAIASGAVFVPCLSCMAPAACRRAGDCREFGQ
jgi:hypothetical protein